MIGLGAVVGANSFVNADVPNFAIVAGSPARIIGYRFNEAHQKLIINSSWWELDIEDAKLALDDLHQKINS